MRCHEIVHTIDAMLRQIDVSTENRILILDHVRSGYDEDGNLIVRSEHSDKVVRCIDCPDKDTSFCDTCPIEPL